MGGSVGVYVLLLLDPAPFGDCWGAAFGHRVVSCYCLDSRLKEALQGKSQTHALGTSCRWCVLSHDTDLLQALADLWHLRRGGVALE